MSGTNRVDVTQDAVNAVMDHLSLQDKFHKEGWAGYKAQYGDKELSLKLYDTTKYKLVPIEKAVTE